jgi:two-component system, OmpR family, response regulator
MNRPNILIVDGDPTAALVTQRGLQRLLNTVADIEVAATPGAAWLRCLRDHIDLVIVDPIAESGAASALIKALHSDLPDISVMVLTAYDTPRLRTQMRTLGVQDYLAKPVDLEDLGRAVRAVMSADRSSLGV